MEKNSEKLEALAENPPAFGLGYRHLIIFLLFLGFIIAYGNRVNMSVAIVAMTDTNSTLHFQTYNWTREEQNIILSSFFWGYAVAQMPAGSISHGWGPHYPLGISMILNSIVTIITPLIAHFGPGAVEASRVISGLTQGFCCPCIHTVCSKWVPITERARSVTFVYGGANLGIVIFLTLSGILAATPLLGWPSIFYSGGVIGIVWGIVWLFFGGNSPSKYRYISNEELKYIEASMGDSVSSQKKIPTPWRAILTSLPLYALLIVHSTSGWSYWTLLAEMPTYMKDILKYDIAKSGWSSALPYLTTWLLTFVFSFSSDFLVNHKIVSTTAARKIYNIIAMWFPAFALIALGYTQNPTVAMILLNAAVGFGAALTVSFGVNHIDLSPNFAGTLMGITNMVASVMSILAPLLVGFIVDEQHATIKEWRIVFFIAAAFNLVGSCIFLIFGTAKLQLWNEPRQTNNAVSVQDSQNQEEGYLKLCRV